MALAPALMIRARKRDLSDRDRPNCALSFEVNIGLVMSPMHIYGLVAVVLAQDPFGLRDRSDRGGSESEQCHLNLSVSVKK